MSKEKSLNEFITQAQKVHKNKYDYSKVNYVNAHDKVCIICPEHGEFWQSPNSHLNNRGCPKCGNIKKGSNKKLTTETFIEKAKMIHGNEYDYSMVEYKNSREKVIIICPKHGKFEMRPVYHLGGSKCPYCADETRHSKRCDSIETFVKKAKEKHGNKYIYDDVNYKNNRTKVTIICPKHGAFYMKPNNHLNGQGCPTCGGTKKLDLITFINKANIVHKNKYDYSKSNYVNHETKICIICPEHGEFWQTPHAHLSGQDCPKCAKGGRNYSYTTDEFILKANIIHDNKYDYSKVVYTNCNDKICIICPKHGEFWQKHSSHLFGTGCPLFKESIMERECSKFLKEHNIKYEQQQTFDWLKHKNRLYLDFYLPDYNMAIECQGEQHFKPVGFGKKNKKEIEEKFQTIQLRDKIKQKLCEEHNIKMLYINYNDNIIEKLNENLLCSPLENK